MTRKSRSSVLGAKLKLRLSCWQAGMWSVTYIIEHVFHWNVIYITFSSPSGMMYKNTMLAHCIVQGASENFSWYPTWICYHCRGRKIPFISQALDDFMLSTSQWYSGFFSSSCISLTQNIVTTFPSLFFNYQFISSFLILSLNAQSLNLEFLFPLLLKPLLFLCNGSENCNSQFPMFVFSLFPN